MLACPWGGLPHGVRRCAKTTTTDCSRASIVAGLTAANGLPLRSKASFGWPIGLPAVAPLALLSNDRSLTAANAVASGDAGRATDEIGRNTK